MKLWTNTGLTTSYVMVVMELKSRRIEIAGITTNPNRQWVTQVTWNLTTSDGFLESASHLILDRDTCFQPLRSFLKDQTEIAPVLLSTQSPNMNGYLERFMRSLKPKCLERMIFSVKILSN
ncbi:MAG: hypothetical protein R3C11_27175 [Planctomycetaceae bacterium]